jgi:hypothetical protein
LPELSLTELHEVTKDDVLPDLAPGLSRLFLDDVADHALESPPFTVAGILPIELAICE